MTNSLERLSINANEAHDCPDCGAHAVHVQEEVRTFLYGVTEPVTLSAMMPVWACSECEFAYIDGRGEEIEHMAICRHLGVLTPQEIRGVRKQHKFSRRELARLTGYGEASIKRWERGAVIQNTSADRFLRLIKDDLGVVKKLRRIAEELVK